MPFSVKSLGKVDLFGVANVLDCRKLRETSGILLNQLDSEALWDQLESLSEMQVDRQTQFGARALLLPRK